MAGIRKRFLQLFSKNRWAILFIGLFALYPSISSAQNIYTDPTKTILIQPAHPEFTIQLPSNRTTGYSWFLSEHYNAALITVLSHQYIPANNTDKTLGKAGYEEWHFKMTPAGFKVPQRLTVTLIYTQPWNLEDAKEATFTIMTTDS